MATLIAPRFRWPLGLAVAAVTLFVFYEFILPETNSDVREVFRNWLSISAVNDALIWVILALGLNIVVGYAGLLDLGFVAFWAIGSYTAGWLMSAFLSQHGLNFNFFGNPQPGQDSGIHINFWAVLVIGALVCALFGVLIGAPTLRLKSDYLALVTLGFGEIIPEFFRNGGSFPKEPGINLTNGDLGIHALDPISVFGFKLGPFHDTYRYVIYVGIVAAIIFVSLRIREGRLGRAWLAIREDELAASAMGIPLMRTKLSAYAVGAVAGGLGGVAYAMHIGGSLPSAFDFSKSIILLGMVVLGGMGNVWGVVLGAFLLSWFNNTGLEQIGNTVNSTLGTEIQFSSYNFLIFGLVLVLMMLFRREGLLPESRTKLVLREPGRTELEEIGADLEDPAPELTKAVGDGADRGRNS